MKAYNRSRSIAPHTLNLGTDTYFHQVLRPYAILESTNYSGSVCLSVRFKENETFSYKFKPQSIIIVSL